jgi:hypothetical protein
MYQNEAGLVDSGLGEGIKNSIVKYVKSYNQAVASEYKEIWLTAIDEEHNKIVNYNMWK